MTSDAAIYARFSSDLQDARSIADQVEMGRRYAESKGLRVVQVYEDAAISGAAMLNRPGLLRLIEDAEKGKFQVVIAESLDRLSRSQAHIAGIYENLQFLGVNIQTLADGVISEMHIGFKGTFAAIYLKDLAQKTRRGQIGRVRAGRIAGGRSFGYDIVKGEEPGLRKINAAEAEIVRRIFRDYCEGLTPLQIVARLNTEGIKGPRGGPWNVSTLLGSAKRRNGILNNELYAGRIVFNRQRFIKNPSSGRRRSRENPQSEWEWSDAPDLRIVDEATWTRVRSVRAKRLLPNPRHHRRPKHLLSGLLTCGGAFIVKATTRGVTYFACSTRMNRAGCSNHRHVPAGQIEARVIRKLQSILLEPEAVKAAVARYRARRAEIAKERAKDAASLEQQLAATTREHDRLMEAIRHGGDEVSAVVQALKACDARRAEIEGRLSDRGQEPDRVVRLELANHRYREIVADLKTALDPENPEAAKAITLARRLITRVVIHPTPSPRPVDMTVEGDLAMLIDASGADRDLPVDSEAESAESLVTTSVFTI